MSSSLQHTKVLNTDSSGSKNRLRFASARQRSQQASADVYRSYKRRIGVVTSSSSREEQVHNNSHTITPSNNNKKRKGNNTNFAERGDKYNLKISSQIEESDDDNDNKKNIITISNFITELDIASDRNASGIFTKFYHEIWYLVRSLPEILHHSDKIINYYLIICYH